MQSDEQREPVSYGPLITGLVLALSVAVFSLYHVPDYARLYDGFGAPLPLLTELVLDFYLLIWLLPLTVLAIALFDPDRAARGRRCLIVGLFGAAIIAVLVQVAMSLPISNMGSVRG